MLVEYVVGRVQARHVRAPGSPSPTADAYVGSIVTRQHPGRGRPSHALVRAQRQHRPVRAPLRPRIIVTGRPRTSTGSARGRVRPPRPTPSPARHRPAAAAPVASTSDTDPSCLGPQPSRPPRWSTAAATTATGFRYAARCHRRPETPAGVVMHDRLLDTRSAAPPPPRPRPAADARSTGALVPARARLRQPARPGQRHRPVLLVLALALIGGGQRRLRRGLHPPPGPRGRTGQVQSQHVPARADRAVRPGRHRQVHVLPRPRPIPVPDRCRVLLGGQRPIRVHPRRRRLRPAATPPRPGTPAPAPTPAPTPDPAPRSPRRPSPSRAQPATPETPRRPRPAPSSPPGQPPTPPPPTATPAGADPRPDPADPPAQTHGDHASRAPEPSRPPPEPGATRRTIRPTQAFLQQT